jgi:uncharacterized protein (DUF934 family)
MPLIKDGAIIDDPYQRVLDEGPLPDGVPVLLPAARFLADAQELSDRGGPIGVIWPNDRDIAELAPYLDRLALVALVFPSFRDGRAYTQARILRERHRFRGELRAVGDVLRDQFLFLHRVGFNAYEVKKPQDASAMLDALHRYSVFYQPAGDGEAGALWRRTGHPGTSRKISNEFAL